MHYIKCSFVYTFKRTEVKTSSRRGCEFFGGESSLSAHTVFSAVSHVQEPIIVLMLLVDGGHTGAGDMRGGMEEGSREGGGEEKWEGVGSGDAMKGEEGCEECS